ncbi:flowering locus K homology domain isoform X2 [Physcomitrium patens]|uniref:K Homology domain-containing protein n=1 Tax=Physcomitrium patens TaxID=3218 RepID=A0A7I4AT15_PHYPA|nr:flowering locus K homology domain-like isoform X2 [Physcomitrium patens]|eukprot:XP_024394898.1 flowering locus K homology domain-like isoform X2 [Physcomitrella patens]
MAEMEAMEVIEVAEVTVVTTPAKEEPQQEEEYVPVCIVEDEHVLPLPEDVASPPQEVQPAVSAEALLVKEEKETEPQTEDEAPRAPSPIDVKPDSLLDGNSLARGPTTPTGSKRSRDGGEEKDGEKKWAGWPGDNVFRLVVPVQKVGGIIGRKGEFVKRMCEETRSRIKILEGVPGTAERIVMVSAREDPEAAISPAMEGLLRVHRRVIEGAEPESVDAEIAPGGAPVSSRLLVAATQAGSLIGRQGATIKSIQDTSGANVRVLPAEELPLCALADDRVVEVQGDPRNVQRAMELVVSHLRKFLVDRSVLPLFELNRAVANQNNQQSTGSQWQQPSSTQQQQPPSYSSNDSTYYGGADISHHSQTQQQSHDLANQHHHGVSMYGRDPTLGGSIAPPPPAPVITQVTQHMQIPLSYADAIIGSAGANISYMRRTSGATITIQETRSVPGEMTVEIHGSASQVQTAQQLIQMQCNPFQQDDHYQNFMTGASSGPPPYTSTYSSTVDTNYSSYPSQPSMYSTTPATGPPAASYASHYNTSYGY